MTRLRLACIAVSTLLCGALAFGCQPTPPEKESFSDLQEIAELSTIECYYHNVAEIRNDGTDYLFKMLNVGYKKAWFEYDGSIELGIDASKVEISQPDEEGTVTVRIPPAHVIGQAKVDSATLSEVYADTGLLTRITVQDQSEAFKVAQDRMREDAESDETFINQAKDRAEKLLEQYVKDVGEAQGKSYKVRFVDIA